MIGAIVLFGVGLVILIKGSDLFIHSSTEIGGYFGIPELIIGLTLLAIGTSFPEFATSAVASFYGSGGIAVGNIVGSNIVNIALILGVCMLVKEYRVEGMLLKRDGLWMLATSFLFTLLMFDGGLSRLDGIMLMAVFLSYLYFLFKKERKGVEDRARGLHKRERKRVVPEFLRFFLGLSGVILGARLLVDSGVEIARLLGVPQSVIGSTLVGPGTSIPELIVSLSTIIRGYFSLSMGNIVGSNIFNILGVGGFAVLIRPVLVDRILLWFHTPVMLVVTCLLLLFMRFGLREGRLRRWEGIVFIFIYIGFLIFNYVVRI